MSEIAVIVPVLNRPQNAQPLADSLRATSDAELVFVMSEADTDQQIDACLATGGRVISLETPPGPGDYARKIQAGYEATDAPYVLLGADDLRFHPGWDTAALALFAEFDVGVVGTVDLGNQQTVAGTHSTHPLVARCYIDSLGGVVGMPGQVYFEGYDHQFVDAELVQTAIARGCYAHCHASVIEHLHPLWRKGEMDDTYRKALQETRADRALFEQRKMLWEREKVTA